MGRLVSDVFWRGGVRCALAATFIGADQCRHGWPQPGVGSEHTIVPVPVDPWRRDQGSDAADQLQESSRTAK